MIASVRSSLMAGIAVVGATAIAVAPVEAPPPDVTPPANRSASVGVVSQARVELLAAIQQMAAAPVATATVDPSPMAAAQPLNAASDFIVNAWNAAVPWINYGVDLADYVLGFVPFAYLIGDQISIVWYSLGLPVANSFVVDLVAPVVNDPLNFSTWVNGLTAVGSTTVTSLINLGINEFNYFFGWLIPPIPPLPLATVAEDAEDTSLTSLTTSASVETGELVTDAGAPEPVVEPTTDDTVSTPTDTDEIDETDEPDVEERNSNEPDTEELTTTDIDDSEDVDTQTTSTTDSSGTVQAQGEVRGADVKTPTDRDSDERGAPTSTDRANNGTTQGPEPSTNDPAATDTDTADTAKGEASEE